MNTRSAIVPLVIAGFLSAVSNDVWAQPAQLPSDGLILRLDAGTITGKVDGAALTEGWLDESGNGHTAYAGVAPTFIADGGGCYPSVRFDGISQYLQADVPTGPEASVFVVYANRRDPLPSEYGDVLIASAVSNAGIHLASSQRDPDGVVQFGWLAESITNTTYKTEIGADEIIQWNGVDNYGATFGANGTLNNGDVGAALTASVNRVTLTTRLIDSSNPLHTNTVLSGGWLGVGDAGGNSNFRESNGSAWAFDFNRQVALKHILINGVNSTNDSIRITIEGHYSNTLIRTDLSNTAGWSGSDSLRSLDFDPPLILEAGTAIGIEAAGSTSPSDNQFSMGAVVMSVPVPEPVIQFGWLASSFTNAAYQTEVGAEKIIQWNGVDNSGGSFGANGTLNNGDVGASLYEEANQVSLTTRLIASTNPLYTNTVLSGGWLGIGDAGGNSSFRESSGSAWAFDFNREVHLQKIFINGMNSTNDSVRITIAGFYTNTVGIADLYSTTGWSGSDNLKGLSFDPPLFVPGSTEIRIEAAGSLSASENQFSMGAIVVSATELPLKYPGFIASADENNGVDARINGHRVEDRGPDIWPNRYYVGSAIYTQVTAASSLSIGGSNGDFGKNDIREIVIYDHALSESNRLAVLTYFEEKYGINTLNRSPDHPVEAYNYILGSQQIGDQYSFGDSGVRVLDGARIMYRQGSRSMKLALSKTGYAVQNGVAEDPAITNLVQLVRDQASIREVMDMPFNDYFFWCTTFAVNRFADGVTTNGFDPALAAAGYAEMYAFAEYLLQQYNGTGKKFYIGNWEGDNILSAGGYSNPYTIPAERFSSMIDWFNFRQSAINAAKAANPGSDVEVYYYVEMNRHEWMVNGDPCLVNTVMPGLTNCDFISFSSWSAREESESNIHYILNQLQDSLPPSSITGPRVIIGEYGVWKENRTFLEQAQAHATLLQKYLSWTGGPPVKVQQWEVFFEGIDTIVTNRLRSLQQIGTNGVRRPLFYMHENFLRDMYNYVDQFYTTSGSVPSRAQFAAMADTVLDNLSYEEYVPDLCDPAIYTIEVNGDELVQIPDSSPLNVPYGARILTGYGQVLPGDVNWSISPTNQGVSIDTAGLVTINPAAANGSYTIVAAATNAAVTGSLEVVYWTPPPGTPGVVQFGGTAAFITDTNYEAQIGAIEIVQWNGVDNYGATFGANGTLVNETAGATVHASTNNVRLTSRIIASSDPAKTNTVVSSNQLGINAANSAANFREDAATSWTFDFDGSVNLIQMLFGGMNAAADAVRISIEGGGTYDITQADMAATDIWSGDGQLLVYTFPTPELVIAGRHITVTATGSINVVNNQFGLNAVVISLTDVPSLVQFGWEGDAVTNPVYRAEIGATEIVQWNGVDNWGATFGANGTLNNAGTGTELEAPTNKLVLTSRIIGSSDPLSTNTTLSGAWMGVGPPGGAANFKESDADTYAFDFDKDVYLSKLMVNGFDVLADSARITIEGLYTNIVGRSNTVSTAGWSGTANLRTLDFSPPLALPAGTDIKIEAAGSVNPPNNQFSLGAVVVLSPLPVFFDYNAWAGLWGVPIGFESDDYDGDGVFNIYEFGLGGDPTNAADQGMAIEFFMQNGQPVFVYPKRSDPDSGLTYYLETGESLMMQDWNNTGYSVSGTGDTGGTFNYVTNIIVTTNSLNVRLMIE